MKNTVSLSVATRPNPAIPSSAHPAEALLSCPAWSVMDKTGVAASGDRHDFYAIGKLAWPDPGTADGLPWSRRDGPGNPAAAGPEYDKARYNTALRRIGILADAWRQTRDERYAAKAAGLIRAWFLDPATRMNPSFRYAAALPGVHDGMPVGIIEGVVLVDLIDHVRQLASSAGWTAADDRALKAWFSRYVDWLLESDFGKSEVALPNNHAAWYAAQVATFSLYSGETRHVRPMIGLARAKLSAAQAADGGFPHELERRQSLKYSIYVLHAYATVARCGGRVGEDFWHYRAENGRGLWLGFAFIAPYLAGEKAWGWPDIDHDKPVDLQAIPLLESAADAYPDLAPVLLRAARHVASRHIPPSPAFLGL